MERYYEICPYCDNEVILNKIKCFQSCPNCNEKIKLCGLCDMDNVKCSNCYLDKK